MDFRMVQLGELRGHAASAQTFYHTPEWIETVHEAYGLESFLLGAFDNGRMEWYMPLMLIKSRLFGSKLVSMPYCDYGGPSGAAALGADAVGELDEIARREGVDYLEIRVRAYGPAARFSAAGLEIYEKPIFVMGLKEPRRMLASLDKKVRNCISKAERCGVEVSESSDIGRFYDLYLRTTTRLGSPPHPRELFDKLFSKAGRKARLLVAELDGKDIAASVFLMHGKTMYYWKNASDERSLRARPNELLIFRAAEWGAANGYTEMDLGRADPGSGTFFFKQKWGGKEGRVVHVRRFYKGGRGVPDASKADFKMLGRVWGMMPAAVSRMIGPSIRKHFP